MCRFQEKKVSLIVSNKKYLKTIKDSSVFSSLIVFKPKFTVFNRL